jgi:hypothetical protein
MLWVSNTIQETIMAKKVGKFIVAVATHHVDYIDERHVGSCVCGYDDEVMLEGCVLCCIVFPYYNRLVVMIMVVTKSE